MNYYEEIKENLINNEIYKKVKDYSKNRSDLETYYKVGKLLSEAGKHYGEGIINEYSIKLTFELGKGYDITNLKRFRKFYSLIKKGATLWHQLTWSHYKLLITLQSVNEINYYSKVSVLKFLSVRELQNIIKNHEYDRLDEKTKNKLVKSEQLKVEDLIPNPIILKTKNIDKNIKEYALKQIILDNLDEFLLQFGNGFSYVGNEYKIKIGNSYNYIDLLLFNYEYNCFVVIELKVTELKKEYIGQIGVYMNYIDNNIKRINQDNTIGIIICKKDNKFVMEYCSDPRILSREYQLI